MCMAQRNLNTRMRKTGNEAFMPWIANANKVDMVVVVMEGVAAVAMDVKVAVVINLQQLMVLIFLTQQAVHL